MSSEISQLMPYIYVFVGLLGLVMGSFLNCLAWRMCNGESVLKGRSHCTSCGHVLAARDLVPVLSWLSTGGKCRYCGERISFRYPATELFCSLMYVSIVVCYGPTLEAIELIAFASVLLVLSLTDLETYTIPNPTIIAAIVIRVAYLCLRSYFYGSDLLASLGESLLGGLVVAVPIILLTILMDFVLGRASFGGGDIKLLFVCGLYFGWQQCLFLIVLACILGLLAGLLFQHAHASDNDDATMGHGQPIPFGPAIALASWLCMLFGRQAVSWYLGLFGL